MYAEYLVYNLNTEAEDLMADMKQVNIPYGSCGKLSVEFRPMKSPEAAESDEPDMIEAPENLIGKPWTARIIIKEVIGLPLKVDLAHVEYDFMDESGSIMNCCTLSVECHGADQFAPKFEYEKVHHIPKVTQAFIDWVSQPIEFHLFVSPVTKIPKDKPVSTKNARLVAAMKGDAPPTVDELHTQLNAVKAALGVESTEDALKEIARLKAGGGSGGGAAASSVAAKLDDAKATDAKLNAA